MRSFIYLTLLPTLFVSTFASNTPQGSPREISQNPDFGSGPSQHNPQTQDLGPDSPHGYTQISELGSGSPRDNPQTQDLRPDSPHSYTQNSELGSGSPRHNPQTQDLRPGSPHSMTQNSELRSGSPRDNPQTQDLRPDSPHSMTQNSELGFSSPRHNPQTHDLRLGSPQSMTQNPELGPSLPQDTLRNQGLGLGSSRVETEPSSPRSPLRSHPGSPRSQSFSNSRPDIFTPYKQGTYVDLLKKQDPNKFGMVKHGFKCQKTLYEHTKIKNTIDRACKMYKNKQQTVGVNRYPKIWKNSKDDPDSKIIFPLSSGDYFGLGGPRNHFVRINLQCTEAEVLYQVQTKPQQASKHRCRLPNCFSRGGKIYFSCTSLWERPHNGPDYVLLNRLRVTIPVKGKENSFR